MALGLGASSLGIGLAIHLRDHFTMKANQVMASMGRLHKNANMVMSANLRAVRNLGIGMAAVGVMGIRAMVGWVKSGMEFQFTMDAVKAITNDTTATFEELRQKALDVAGTSIFTPKQVADGMKYLGMAGFARKEIIATMDAVVALGAAADVQIAGKGGAGDMLTNMMTAFGLTADKAMHTADVLVKMAVSANVSVMDLHEALKYSAADFTMLGYDFETAAASIAALGNAGIQGSIAGTALGNMLRKLGIAMTDFKTKRQAKGLSWFGIDPQDIVDSEGRMKSLVGVMATFMKKVKMGDTRALAASQAITGIRGSRGLTPLIREIKMGLSHADLDQLARQGVDGEALRIALERISNIKGQSLLLVSAWSKFKIIFTDVMAPMLLKVLKILTKVVNKISKFAQNKWGKYILYMAAGMVVLTTVTGVFFIMLGGIGRLMQGTIISFKGMKMAGVWAWNKMTAAVMGYTAAAQGATWMGAGGVYTKKGTKSFQSSAKAIGKGGWIKSVLSWLSTVIGVTIMTKLGNIVTWLGNAFKSMTGWFVSLRVSWSMVARVAGRFTGYVGILIALFEALGFTIKDMWYGVGGYINYILLSIWDGVKRLGSIIPGWDPTGGQTWSQASVENWERAMPASYWEDPNKEGYIRRGATPAQKEYQPIINLRVEVAGEEVIRRVVKEYEYTDLATQLGVGHQLAGE